MTVKADETPSTANLVATSNFIVYQECIEQFL